jgi:hypothetical protein
MDQKRLFVFDNGKAKTLFVNTGIQDNNYIEVLTGLKPDQEVITALMP